MDLTLVLNLLILLVLAKLSGEALAKKGYPSVVGEIFTGILLGPSVLRLINPNNHLELFADLGFLLILLYAGLSLETERFFQATRKGLIISVGDVGIPMILGYSIGRFFNYPDISSISLGIALSISSVGFGTRVLIDLKRLKTLVGMAIVSVAVIDDITGVLLLGTTLSIASTGGIVMLNQLFLRILAAALFLTLIIAVGFKMKIPDRLKKMTERSNTMGIKLFYVFAVLFTTMSLAYLTGLEAIVGAFFAGLMLNRAFKDDKETHETIKSMTFGLFAPVAFGFMGLNTLLPTLIINIPLFLCIMAAGFVGKILGGGLGAKITGFSWRESLVVGIGLTGRAGIELVVLEVLRRAGLITLEVYSSLIILTAMACVGMPLMLKFACTHVLRKVD
ncbi:MAG: cation:proton antiporter [Candidatus Bathyarchaeia archaeon]